MAIQLATLTMNASQLTPIYLNLTQLHDIVGAACGYHDRLDNDISVSQLIDGVLVHSVILMCIHQVPGLIKTLKLEAYQSFCLSWERYHK